MHWTFICFIIWETVSGALLSDIKGLNLSSKTQIELASNSSNFTQRWSTFDAPNYLVAVKPVTEEDVSKIIRYATESSIPFLATGGGHGFPITLGKLQDGIELDLSNFNSIEINAYDNEITIGGAVRFGDVVGPLGQAHKELPIGSEPCVGMVGATLGGGISRWNGLHGMLSDTLLSVKMVIADGQIITASDTENEDLFWGIRGAGFNYGTILEATYKIFDETAPLVLNADFLFTADSSKTILEFFKSLENDLPPELSLILLAGFDSALGGSIIFVNAVYAGLQTEGEKYIQPLLNASPILSNLTMIPWSSINTASFFGAESGNFTCPTGTPHIVYGAGVSYIDIPTFQTFYENYENLTSSLAEELNGSEYFVEFFSKKAVEEVPANSTAYPWRNITAHILIVFSYNDITGGLDDTINDFGRAARGNFTRCGGFSPPELNVLYGHGDESLETLYSADNLPRLKALKEKWDPENAYRYNYPLIL